MGLYRPMPTEADLRRMLGLPVGRELRMNSARDYLTLLGLIFYFPQHLSDYVDTLEPPPKKESAQTPFGLSALIGWLRANPIQSTLLAMGAILGITVLGLILVGIAIIAYRNNASAGLIGQIIAYGGIIGIIILCAYALFITFFLRAGIAVALSVPTGIAIGALIAILTMIRQVHFAYWSGTPAIVGLICGCLVGIAISGYVAALHLNLNGYSATFLVSFMFGLGVTSLIWLSAKANSNFFFSVDDGWVALGSCLLGSVAGVGLGIVRVDDWLIGLIRNSLWNTGIEDDLRIPHVTPLAHPYLYERMLEWFGKDWETALKYARTLWNQTCQQQQIQKATGAILAEANDDKLVELVGSYADMHGFEFEQIIRLPESVLTIVPPGSSPNSKKPASVALLSPSERRKLALKRNVAHALHRPMRAPQLSTATRQQAIVSGFCHLARGYIDDAAAAFDKGPKTGRSKELIEMVNALKTLTETENLLYEPQVKLPTRPGNAKRGKSWEMLDNLQTVVRYGWIFRQCRPDHPILFAHTPSGKAGTPTIQTKRDEAQRVARTAFEAITNATELPLIEMTQIKAITGLWRDELDKWFSNPPDRKPMKAVENPFVHAEPLRNRDLFVGRQAELDQIKTIWGRSSVQVLLVYGQPLIGKTSLLEVAGAANSGQVDLLRVRIPAIQTAKPLREIFETLTAKMRDTGLLEDSPADKRVTDPQTAFESNIQTVCARLGKRKLIIALDDFDQMERQIKNAADLDHFMKYLGHLFQIIPNFGLVFTYGQPEWFFRHRPENPFARTALHINLGCLDVKATTQLLHRSTPGFVLRFADDALEYTQQLTGGHPYLVQLIGHFAVVRFNRLAESGHIDPLFDSADIREIVNDTEFMRLSQQYYQKLDKLIEGPFEKIVRPLIQQIAHNETPTIPNTVTATDPTIDLDRVLKALSEFGVITFKDGKWHIKIDLYQRWLVR